MRVTVLGGGVSGLTAAVLADAAGHDVVCVDPGRVAGGLIRSETHEGFLCEVGPQAVLDDAPDTLALLASLGLRDRALAASAAARRRFIFARGALRLVPGSPPALLKSGLLSPVGKLRLLLEPFISGAAAGRRAPDDDAETVTAFGDRRLGREATRVLLATAVIGIYASDAATLSLASAFPRIDAMERQHGSLLRAILAGRRAGRRRGQPLSFPNGLGELPAALARALGPRLWRARATAVEPRASGGWRVSLETIADAGAAPSVPTERETDAVVVATDAGGCANLLGPLVPAARDLGAVPCAPIALACLGFRDVDARPLGMDLAAYGFLVARGAGPLLLGCQYESSTFSGRAPEGGGLLRAILGGLGAGFEPGIVDRTDDGIAARALDDLRVVARLGRDPDVVRVWRHPLGIPQYRPGHAARVAGLDAALRAHPGLFVLGHAVRGVGVNESIRAATRLVEALGPVHRAG